MNIDMPERRVVITGMGVISPSGKDLKTLWNNVRGGLSAAAPVSRFDTSKLPVKIAAEVKDFDVGEYVKSRKPGRFDLTIQYGVAAATMAVKDSGLDVASMDPDRVGVIEGTTISGMESIIKTRDTFVNNEGNFRALHPYNLVASYCGEGSGTISLHLGIQGHAVTYCSGCASGNDALGYAARRIRDDDMDVVIAGGADETMEMLHVGFCRLRAMTEQTGEPAQAMRPFDRTRDGFVLGEGAAFFRDGGIIPRARPRGAHLRRSGRARSKLRGLPRHRSSSRRCGLCAGARQGAPPRAACSQRGGLYQCPRLGDAFE
jgi:3-oxoacyl-[acyl-carrier-protein] synthase II